MSERTRTASGRTRRTKRPTPQSIIERNRRNAARSTGPRTDEGKARSRWNALKHGILCREMLITHGDGKESGYQLKRLISALRDDLKPVGVLEEIMVEKIAGCYWRLRRVMRAEVGEIQKRLDFSAARVSARMVDALGAPRRAGDEPSHIGSRSGAGIMLPLLEEATKELAILDDIRECLVRDGSMVREDFQRIAKDLSQLRSAPLATVVLHRLTSESLEAKAAGATAADRPVGEAATAASQDRDAKAAVARREQTLSLIDSLKRAQSNVVQSASERSIKDFAATLNATVARYHLPDRNAARRLRLYEASISRELYRAMREFRELQSERLHRSSGRARRAAKP